MALLLSGTAQPAPAQSVPRTLLEAVEAGLALHPAMRAESARLGAARASIAEASAAGRFQVRADAFGTRFQEPMVVAPLHGFDPQQPPLFDRTLAQLQASASLTLFDGGLGRSRVGQAEAGADLSAAQLKAARSVVIMEVAEVWLRLATSRELLAVEEARMRSRAGSTMCRG
jgi:outer membrane protein TolC